MAEWRDNVLEEIRLIKPFWASKFGWNPSCTEHDDVHIDLFVQFVRRRVPEEGPGRRRFVLRLRYESDYLTAGRRETFVNPEKTEEEGIQFWPEGIHGINPKKTPPTICLEGTWGFHSHHHRDRDGRVARLNRLLMEMEKCLNS